MKKATAIMLVIAAVIITLIYFVFFARVAPPNFAEADAGKERKAMFFDYFSPIITEINAEIKQDRIDILSICKDGTDLVEKLAPFAEKYRVDDDALENRTLCQVLSLRVDEVPVSLALAQGANESAWGTARFAQQGNNFFGQWCFKKGCGIVPKSRSEGKVHEVASFRSPKDSVRSYIMNINTHNAYLSLRTIRQLLRKQGQNVTGIALSHGLNKYSERGEAYGEELREMIRFNELSQFDES